MFLIDTMVLSPLRRRERTPGVVAWVRSQRHGDCFLSGLSLGEIEGGIARQQSADPVLRPNWPAGLSSCCGSPAIVFCRWMWG